MWRLGQAGRAGAWRSASGLLGILTAVSALLLNAAVAAAVLLGALVWRLGQGPLSLPWAVPLIEARAAAAGHPVTVGDVTVAWNGFADGAEAPVSVTVGRVRLGGQGADPQGLSGDIAEARASLAVSAIVAGDTMPRSLSLDGVHLRVNRPANGPTSVAGAAAQQSRQARKVAPLFTLPDSLRSIHVRDLTIDASDAGSGLSGRLSNGRIDGERDGAVIVRARLHADLDAGGQHATLDLTSKEAIDGHATSVEAKLSPIDPAALADLTPSLAPLSMFDAPVAISATARFGTGLAFQQAHGTLAAGAGLIRAGQGTTPVVSLDAAFDVTPGTVEASDLRFVTAPSPDGPRTTFTGHGKATRAATGYAVAVTLDVDRLNFSDLAAIWPAGVGGRSTRPWITENIVGGTAANGHVEADLTASTNLSTVALNRIDGHLDGHDVTLFWLRPVPPVLHGEARLTITNPDVIDIAVLKAREDTTDLRFDGATVRLTGIAGDDQSATISGPIEGSLPDVIRILSNPRLKLLSKSPVRLGDTAGHLRGTLAIAHLPLRAHVSLSDLGIVSDARLRDVHIGKLVDGRDLDHAQLALHVTNQGLDVGGTGAVAQVPAKLSVAIDFADGPPEQVQETARVATTLDRTRLKRLGVDTGSLLAGSFGVDAEAKIRRDGRTDIVARADLADAAFGAAMVPWHKVAGDPATGDAALSLDRNGAVTLRHLRANGPGIDVDMAAELASGRPTVVRVNRLRLGTAIDLAGTVAFPHDDDKRYVVDAAGPTLDLSGVRAALARPGGNDAAGPPFVVTARIDRVAIGDGRALLDVAAHVERDRDGVRDVELSGATPGPLAAPFRVAMHPTPYGRRVEAHTGDLGAVLAGFGVFDGIGGGRLDVTGAPKLDALGRPSTVGVATLDAFRILDAPWTARLLKALTLYGIVDLLRGPGVGVNHAVAPFELNGDVLTLRGARAVSLSLGVTIHGQIDLGRELLAVRGTVVPAYVFNALPGRLPLIGRLFSPERGGGLVAAMFSLKGNLSDPAITVNPLSLLTPGALRGLFGGFATPTLGYSAPETKLSSQ